MGVCGSNENNKSNQNGKGQTKSEVKKITNNKKKKQEKIPIVTNNMNLEQSITDEEMNFYFRNNYPLKFESECLENKLEEKISNLIYPDSYFDQISSDEIFELLKQKERKQLIELLEEKQLEFPQFHKNYCNFQKNYNFTEIVKKILENENGKNIYIKKLKKEIHKMQNDINKHKIKYLTIMLVGKSGVGKSTLINNLLKLTPEEKAKIGIGNFITTESKAYSSKAVPYLKLVDTRGIELNANFGAEEVRIEAKKYIDQQLQKNEQNDFVQCIWYCITGARFEKAEKDLLNSLRKAYGESRIPIIIVYTQATDDKMIKEMSKCIKKDYPKDDFIKILAEEKELIDDEIMEPFGLDELIKVTLKKCKNASSGEMAKVMTKKLKEDVFAIIKNENSYISSYIYETTILNFVSNYNESKNINGFLDYIIRNIFCQNINYYLNVNNKIQNMSDESYKLFSESDIMNEIKDYFIKSKQFIKGLIIPFLQKKAIIFLDEQVAIQQENNKEIEINNLHCLEELIKIAENFLTDSLCFKSQVIYICFIIKIMMKNLIQCFENNLNNTTKSLLENYLLNKSLSSFIKQKFTDFENNIHNKLSQKKTDSFQNGRDNYEKISLPSESNIYPKFEAAPTNFQKTQS